MAFEFIIPFVLVVAVVIMARFIWGVSGPIDFEVRREGVFLPSIAWTILWDDIVDATISANWSPWWADSGAGGNYLALRVRNGFVVRAAHWPRWFALFALAIHPHRAGDVLLRIPRIDEESKKLLRYVKGMIVSPQAEQP